MAIGETESITEKFLLRIKATEKYEQVGDEELREDHKIARDLEFGGGVALGLGVAIAGLGALLNRGEGTTARVLRGVTWVVGGGLGLGGGIVNRVFHSDADIAQRAMIQRGM